MDYLVYISHDAENLQFFLWLQDYTRRFQNMPNSEQCLSPAWKFKEAPRTLMPITRSSERTLASMGIKDLSVHLGEEDNFNEDVLDNLSHPASPTAASSSQTVSVAEANIQAGLKWQACKAHPSFPPVITPETRS